MTSEPRTSLTTGGKLLVSLFVLFAIVGFIDYAFYGQQLRNLLSGIGFSLLAYGTLKNGLSGAQSPQTVASYATISGSILLVVAIALRFLQ